MCVFVSKSTEHCLSGENVTRKASYWEITGKGFAECWLELGRHRVLEVYG